jgi:hypothetical protein
MSPFKTNLITMRVEDLDKNLHYEKYNRNGKAVINIMCVVFIGTPQLVIKLHDFT